APGLGELEADEVARAGTSLIAGSDRPLLELPPVDGVDDPAPLGARAKDAELTPAFARQAPDRLGLAAIAEHVGIRELRELTQDAVTLTQHPPPPRRPPRQGPHP